jgi:hypothetical protein
MKYYNRDEDERYKKLNESKFASLIFTQQTSNKQISIEKTTSELILKINKEYLAKTSTYDILKLLTIAIQPFMTGVNKNIKPPLLEGIQSENKSIQHVIFFMDGKPHYSGGRYVMYHFALLLSQYIKVTFITNIKPPFYDDFKHYLNNNFTLISDFTFSQDLNIKADLAVGIPIISAQYAYDYAQKNNISYWNFIFESPNWMTSMKKESGDSYEEFWKSYKEYLKKSNKIITLSRESVKWLKEWIGTDIEIDYIYPCINQVIANRYDESIIKMDELFAKKRGGTTMLIDLANS